MAKRRGSVRDPDLYDSLGNLSRIDELREMRKRQQSERYENSLNRYLDSRAKIREERMATTALDKKLQQERDLAGDDIAARERRDAAGRLHDFAQTNQRAGIAADSDAAQFGYQSQRDRQQQKDLLQRDVLEQRYTHQRDRQQELAQQRRDATQHGYQVQDDERTQGYQAQRDARLQGYDVQNDERRFKYDSQRDEQQFGFETQRDERQQGYTEQNATQRETFDVSAKWQDQIQQARNNGMDFSEKQKQEMKSLEESFLKNVMNGPYDEGLKQQAMLAHQRKLSAIIPNERVANPDEEISQTFKYNKEMGTWLKRGRDSQGNPDWEPLGNGKSQAEDPQTARQREAMFEREKEFQKIKDKLEAKADIDTGKPLYSPEKIDELARTQFAPMEKHYREQYGLPPQASYQNEADLERQKIEQQTQQRQEQMRQLPSQYDRRPEQKAPSANQPPVLSGKSPLSSEVSKQLKAQPGGEQLHKIREKHKSNSAMDQTVRMAADVVINSILTKDTSDPDFAEAMDILERAGFKVER